MHERNLRRVPLEACFIFCGAYLPFQGACKSLDCANRPLTGTRPPTWQQQPVSSHWQEAQPECSACPNTQKQVLSERHWWWMRVVPALWWAGPAEGWGSQVSATSGAAGYASTLMHFSLWECAVIPAPPPHRQPTGRPAHRKETKRHAAPADQLQLVNSRHGDGRWQKLNVRHSRFSEDGGREHPHVGSLITAHLHMETGT